MIPLKKYVQVRPQNPKQTKKVHKSSRVLANPLYLHPNPPNHTKPYQTHPPPTGPCNWKAASAISESCCPKQLTAAPQITQDLARQPKHGGFLSWEGPFQGFGGVGFQRVFLFFCLGVPSIALWIWFPKDLYVLFFCLLNGKEKVLGKAGYHESMRFRSPRYDTTFMDQQQSVTTKILETSQKSKEINKNPQPLRGLHTLFI